MIDMINEYSRALEKAKEELSKACHFIECGSNAGIRKMNENKADWLKWLIYLAERGLAEEKLLAEQTEEVVEEAKDGYPICEHCPVSAEAQKLIKQRDKTVKELCNKINEITERLKSLQVTYDCELEYRKALAQRAKVDYFTEVLRVAHDRCWLDGSVLVCPVDYLDRCLLELIKE